MLSARPGSRARSPTLPRLLALAAAMAIVHAPSALAMAEGAELVQPVAGGVYVNGELKSTSSLLPANTASVTNNLAIHAKWQCPQGAVSASATVEIFKLEVTPNGLKETSVKKASIGGGAQGGPAEVLTWGPKKSADSGDYKIKLTVVCKDRNGKAIPDATYTDDINVVWTKV